MWGLQFWNFGILQFLFALFARFFLAGFVVEWLWMYGDSGGGSYELALASDNSIG